MKIYVDGKLAQDKWVYMPGDSSGNVWSSEETLVGKWFDEDLYRRVIQFTCPNNTTDTIVGRLDTTYVPRMINAFMWFKNSSFHSLTFTYLNGSSVSDIRNVIFYYHKGNFRCMTNEPQAYGQPIYVVLHYTKNTAEVGDSNQSSLAFTPTIIPENGLPVTTGYDPS